MQDLNSTKNKMKTLLTVQQTAHMLGVSQSSIRKWQHQGKLPYLKIFGAVRFDPCELENLIEQSTLKLEA